VGERREREIKWGSRRVGVIGHEGRKGQGVGGGGEGGGWEGCSLKTNRGRGEERNGEGSTKGRAEKKERVDSRRRGKSTENWQILRENRRKKEEVSREQKEREKREGEEKAGKMVERGRRGEREGKTEDERE